jgi:hypothetical protein
LSRRCISEGNPTPKISWRVNGVAIEESDKYSVNPVSGELTVRGAESEDEGVYECTAANHGQVRAAAQLTVKSKTQIIEGPSDQEATVFTSLKVTSTQRK